MSRPLDPPSPAPGENSSRPPTLEEFAEILRKRLGPDCPVTIRDREPPSDGTVKTKFFFVNSRQNTDAKQD